jgi:hypothetical protein
MSCPVYGGYRRAELVSASINLKTEILKQVSQRADPPFGVIQDDVNDRLYYFN